MNWIDKLVSAVNPIAGAKRQAARMALNQIRNYESAGKGRRTDHWKRSSGSADADLLPVLESLRNTSRDMVRNNSYAFKAIDTLVTNIIGQGIRPNITSENKTILPRVKQAWKDWAEKPECDFMGDMNFYGIQSLSTRSRFESGECLIVRRKLSSRDKSVLPIRLQVLEPDFIDTHKTQINLGSGNYINQGIEYNAKGQRVAYWLFKEHPGNSTGYYATSERYDAADIIHYYRKLRPGQERGVPAGVSAHLRLNDFDDFEDAELMKQKIAACFAIFITGDTDLPGGESTSEDPTPREKLAPGIIERLENGKTVHFASPPVNSGQEASARQYLRGAAAGYSVTYEGLTGDLKNMSFSSGRLGELGFQRVIVDDQQNVVIPKVCERVFTWFLDALFLKEGISPELIKVDWTAPRREMIDIVKETKAIGEQILLGITSWSEAVREQGFNADDLLEQIKKDQDTFKKLGITLMSDPNIVASQPKKEAKPTEENEDDEDENGAKQAKED